MKAAQINEYGHADKVEVVETDTPRAGEGQVQVEVQAASLNPFDTMVREGYVAGMIKSLPITLGGDIAGVVRAVGQGVDDVAVGDIVYGQANVVAGNSGAFAEYAVTKAEQVAKAPANLDITEAASLPLIGVSALQALVDHIKLESGQKIFIHGGGGGIGSVAIQVAKKIGAYVATTATGDDLEYVTGLGADEVIDYKASDFSQSLHDYDAVFDTVGGDDFTKSLDILKKGGIAVSMAADADEAKASERGVTTIHQMTHVTSDKLKELTKLVEEGTVTARINKVYDLADIQAAFEARESGAKGKIVIRL